MLIEVYRCLAGFNSLTIILIHAEWDKLLAELKTAKVDDQTVITSVQELARLKKIITFIDKMINSIDPELIPSGTWDSFNTQAKPCAQRIVLFNSDRNIVHIQQANAHADNLITYVRPYMVAYGKAAKAMQEAVKGFAEVVSGYMESFEASAGGLLGEIQDMRSEAKQSQSEIQLSYDSVEKLNAKLFGNEGQGGLEEKVETCARQVEDKVNEINAYHDEILVGEAKNPSKKQLLADAEEEILARRAEINQILSDVEQKEDDLAEFHTKIFGKLNEDDIREGGLEKDFEDRITMLGQFENKQVDKYNALNKQIESLLPGATSAGLAAAYGELKRSFNKPIQYATVVFLMSIVLMFFVAILSSFKIGGDHWFELYNFDTWESVLKGLVHKTPIYVPIIWLAFVASKRRSEYQRLQQEYAHKEALAKSYDSYKKQLESLDDQDKSMQKELIRKAVDAIAYNASQTLDGHHGDKHPVQDFFGKFPDKLKSNSKNSDTQ
ncbi:hypothetical protein [Candidatus Nitrotoga fabula]|uniref:Uncharacterized protein n=1 Tax=Candidatus Nitrotoga fabula TaxID=2182327 RepID=A0A916BBR6_9PROT|nr:hypothetical protein [Candidatus Nitrotoga fabula]CAE6707867.1 conserved hypothetical protein [Candidatus Nitrotoga fabula]